MKTDELITVLAAQAEVVDPRAPARRLALAAVIGFLVALPVAAWQFGINPELASDAHLPMFWVRVAFAALLALGTAQLLVRLARPGTAIRLPWLAALALIGLWVLAAVVLTDAAPADRTALILGSTWQQCPWSIALLSVPAFVLLFMALHSLAPTRLRTAGAAAGALAGALGVLAYCIHCPELAAPFIAVWYVLGIAIPAAIGALIGPRALRW